MISYRDITAGLSDLGLMRSIPTVAHINLQNLGEVKGGIKTVVGAVLATVDNVLMPSFTYSTMIIPESGPPDNDLQYGSGRDSNLQATIYHQNLPSDIIDNQAVEELRKYPGIFRSSHPVFSFVGLGMDIALINHPPHDPYAPLRAVRKMNAWVLLMGAEPAANFSLHLAEMLAGRKQFIRWALTSQGVKEVPYFPGCSDGFHKVHYYLQDELHTIQVAGTDWYAVNLDVLISTAVALIEEDAFALLCNNINCVRCNLVRDTIKKQFANQWHPED